MKILYGTGNPAKLAAMRRRMETLNLEIIGLKEIDGEIPSVPEDGNTPLENARQKALAYYRVFHMPVFSCDSGLYFENVPEKDQPGVHVRNINGRCLSDEEMISHYAGLAVKYGNLTAKYKNAICFVMDETHIYEAMEPSMESVSFIITSKPHGSVPQKGFPLDCLSVDRRTGKYYYDLPETELDQVAVEDGFLSFFRNIFGGEKYQIREIRPQDNKKIERVIRSCLIEFGADHEGTAWADPDLGRFSEIYNTEGTKYWVACRSDGTVVGGAGIGKLDGAENICELQKMYCIPEARGTGISHKLMENALEYAKNHYSGCYLETLENMTAARKFYEKYGFRRVFEPIGKTEHFACDVRYIRQF